MLSVLGEEVDLPYIQDLILLNTEYSGEIVPGRVRSLAPIGIVDFKVLILQILTVRVV